uniref:Uncharacterized protein n=1 Tax=Nelumbo nucifera TaxID=4432 RepID=A0A822ZD40_NELNU|nr:TPA_asm: hypothetical protein HUJ06_000703 [Nelumbo nucifera]
MKDGLAVQLKNKHPPGAVLHSLELVADDDNGGELNAFFHDIEVAQLVYGVEEGSNPIIIGGLERGCISDNLSVFFLGTTKANVVHYVFHRRSCRSHKRSERDGFFSNYKSCVK